MNNIFSWHRFLLLLRKEAVDLRPKLIKVLLISFCIGLGVFLFTKFQIVLATEPFPYEKFRVFIGLMVMCVNVFIPLFLYAHFNHRATGVNYFMLPASQLEKWLVMFFYSMIVAPLLSILGLMLADLCLFPVYTREETAAVPWFLDIDAIQYYFINQLAVVFIFLTILTFQSAVFLCNIWFQKKKMLKTLIVVCIMFVVSIVALRMNKLTAVHMRSLDEQVLSIASSSWASWWRTCWIVQQIMTVLIIFGIWYAGFLKWKEQEL